MTTTEPTIPTVPVLGIYACFAREKLQKLAKRAAKYGQTIRWTETPRIEKRRKVLPTGVEKEVEEHFVDFAVEGEAPRVGEFKLLAALERLEGGVLISPAGRDAAEVGKLGRTWDGRCDHCKSNRARSYGYVVEDAKGKRKIVGKSCLRDHLGTDVPASALWIFTHIRDWAGEDEEGWGGGGYAWFESIEGVVATTRACIALWGWRPSSHEGMTTSTYVGIMFGPVSRDHKGRDVHAEERKAIETELKARGEKYQAEAEAIVEWGRNLKPRSDYEHNLRVAMSSDLVRGKTFNLVVSACAAYDRQVAREDEVKAKRLAEEEARRNRPPSDWVGQIGQRRDFGEVLVERVISLPDNGFGPSQIYKFVCDDGAILSWKSGSFPRVGGEPVRANDRVRLVATVKDHGEFREVRETRLTRAKMEKPA